MVGTGEIRGNKRETGSAGIAAMSGKTFRTGRLELMALVDGADGAVVASSPSVRCRHRGGHAQSFSVRRRR
jgi:hypothetical protein